MNGTTPPRDIPPRLVTSSERFTGRLWALEAVDRWLATRSSLLVLTGDPGAGKSALAAWLVGAGPTPAQAETAQALARLRERWGVVHFCALQWERGSADPRHFTENLARQLAAVDGFTDAVLERLAPLVTITQDVTATDSVVNGIGNLTLKGLDTLEVFRTTVVAPLTGVMQKRPDLAVAVLVDGLDEAATTAAPTVIDLLSALLSVPGVQLLVGTRRQSEILGALDDGRGVATYLDLSAEGSRQDAETDVRGYVTARLGSSVPDLETAVDEVVAAAEGNFAYAVYLLDELTSGTRAVTDLSGLPRTLGGLYDSSLNRLRQKHGTTWEDELRPLLALVTVAFGGAPVTALAAWSGAQDEGVVSRRLTDLSPLVRYDDDHDGWRLFHRSMAEFLSDREVVRQGSVTSNEWFVDPAKWHRVIAGHYLEAAAGGWDTVDDYGVRNVLQHLERAAALSLAAGGPRADADADLGRISTLLRSKEFHTAQQARVRERNPYARDVRACVTLLLAERPLAEVLEVVRVLAEDPRPPVRATAVDALVRAHAKDPGPTRDVLVELLHGGPTTRGIALNAMRFLGTAALDLFVDVASSPDDETRRATVIALYLLWRPGPENVTTQVMNRVAEQVAPKALTKLRSRLEFLSDLSIAVYANHCELPEVTRATSDLWHTTLKDRLHLGAVNRPLLEPVLKTVVSTAFARRIVETAWLTDPGAEGGTPKGLDVSPEDAARIERVLPALDPAGDLAAVEADLAALLASPIPLLRVTAAIVLNVHAHVDLAATAALANRLFDSGTGDARLWTVLAFTTHLPEAPQGWTEVVEKLTRRLLLEEPASFLAPGSGALQGFDVALLPLAHAGADGAAPPLSVVTEVLSRADGPEGGVLRRRVVESLAPVGMVHPSAVLGILGPVLGTEDLALRASLVRCLSVVRVADPDAVDQTLASSELQDLREEVIAGTDVESVWRYVWWIGLYKNAVHQSVHYPQMRRELLEGGLRTLFRARSARAFLSTYSGVVLRMVRAADYQLIRWTGA